MTRAGDDDVDARDSAREETTSAGRAPSRVLVVGGGRVGAYLARAFRRGEVERVALKTSNRAARAGDETREAARVIASDAGAIVNEFKARMAKQKGKARSGSTFAKLP